MLVSIFLFEFKNFDRKMFDLLWFLPLLVEIVSYPIFRIDIFSLLYFVYRTNLAEVELHKLERKLFH